MALKHDLSLSEVRLLLYLRQIDFPADRRTLADFAGLSRGTFAVLSQRLISKDLLKLEEVRSPDRDEGKRVRVVFPPEAAAVLSELDRSLADYRQAAFSGFTPEERRQYLSLSRRLQDNLQKTL